MKDFRDRGHLLRFGLVTPPMWRSWDDLLDLWTRAEAAGYDAAFVTDHFLSDWDGEDGSTLEAFTLLAALAREVPRIAIGVYVTGITHRPPAVLAKQAVTVDHVSGGRLIFGVGAAWNEREHAAYGIPFPDPGDRVDLFGEAMEAIRLLERDERVTYAGDHVALVEAPFVPKPVRGHMPILVGSRGKRMMRHVARYADYWDLGKADPESIAQHAARLAGLAAEIGRDPDDIVWMQEEILRDGDTAGDLAARVDALAPLGVSFFLVNAWPKRDPSLLEKAAAAFPDLRRRHA